MTNILSLACPINLRQCSVAMLLVVRNLRFNFFLYVSRAGSDGSMFASGSAGPGFDPRRGSIFFLFENFQPRGLEGWRYTLSNR